MSKLKYYDGTNWKVVNGQVTGDTLPIGAIVPFGGWDAPTGWLICDGTLLNKTAYPELFNAIGYSFGGEEGGSTFGLPDLRGRVPLGLKETDTDFNGMGLTGGEKTHTLTIQEMPNHNHMERIFSENYNDGKSIAGNRAYARSFADTAGGWNWSGNGKNNGQIVDVIETTNAGSGQAHNNLQPYQTVNYIIKAKQSAGLVANVSNIQSDSTTDTYSCNYINGIVESGSNANGSYVKYIDGTMICYKTLTGSVDLDSSTMGGAFYYAAVDLGEPAVNFIARPAIITTLQSQTGTQGILSTNSNTNYGGATYLGYVSILRPTQRNDYQYIIDVMAIGKWK